MQRVCRGECRRTKDYERHAKGWMKGDAEGCQGSSTRARSGNAAQYKGLPMDKQEGLRGAPPGDAGGYRGVCRETFRG